MTTSLVTLSEIKDFIKTKSGFTDNDALYTSLGLKATKIIEQYTRRSFTKSEYTEYFGTRKCGKVAYDLRGNSLTGFTELNEPQKFYLKNTPVDTDERFLVYFDFNRVWNEDALLSTDIYWVEDSSGILTILTYVPKSERTIKVIYTAGYEATTVGGATTLSGAAPEDLKLACLVTVVNLFNRANDRMFGMRQFGSTDDDADFSHYGMIPPEAREILLPYRKTFVGRY